MVDQKKFKELIVKLIELENGKMIGLTRLAKLVLFTDIEAFKSLGESITSDVYVREKQGPVPSHLYEILEQLEREGIVREQIEQINGLDTKCYVVVKPLPESYLSENEISVIERTYRELGKLTGKELSAKAHELPAWRYSEPGEPLFISELSVDEKTFWVLQDALEDVEDDDSDVLELLVKQELVDEISDKSMAGRDS